MGTLLSSCSPVLRSDVVTGELRERERGREARPATAETLSASFGNCAAGRRGREGSGQSACPGEPRRPHSRLQPGWTLALLKRLGWFPVFVYVSPRMRGRENLAVGFHPCVLGVLVSTPTHDFHSWKLRLSFMSSTCRNLKSRSLSLFLPSFKGRDLSVTSLVALACILPRTLTLSSFFIKRSHRQCGSFLSYNA